MKRFFLTGALSLLCGLASAQQATISTTNVDASAGYNLNTQGVTGSTSFYFSNNANTLLAITNTSSTAVTATIVTQAASVNVTGFGPVSLTNNVVTIPASGVVLLGPFQKGRWNTLYDTVGVSLTAPTYVSVSAVRIPQ